MNIARMRYTLILPTLTIFLLLPAQYLSADRYYAKPKEHWYQDVWCQGKGGEIEHKLKDGRRVDCLTKDYAIEVEFARKWSEAIGQSMDYSMLTDRKAGIVLILQSQSDHIYWQRLQQLIHHYQLPITIWKLGP